MSTIGTSVARTTALLSGAQLTSALRKTQSELMAVQKAIMTGKSVNTPSEAPERTAAILLLNQQLSARGQFDRNLTHAEGLYNVLDAVLSDASGVLLDAKSIALAESNTTSNADTRANQAAVIDAQLQGLISLANQQFHGVSIFGGNKGAAQGKNVFVEFLGGVRYLGSDNTNLKGEFGFDGPIDFNSNGGSAFGALSSRVRGKVDLTPQAAANVRIADVNGARGTGVQPGSVALDVNGQQISVDLSTIDTLGDVVTRINHAIDQLDPGAGQIALTASGFELTAAGGSAISIADTNQGVTAADLGIVMAAASGSVAGSDVNPRVTLNTRLNTLAGLDLASGLLITHGGHSKVADFSGAQTVQDMVNVINQLELGLRMEVNAEGTGLDLISEVSGLELSIGENGGTTATDLGLRSFGQHTQLDAFRHGAGVKSVAGENDFAIELHDGSRFEVNLDGAGTVGDVLNLIRDAALGTGLNVGAIGDGGTDFNVGLAANGNGFAFEDGTAGGDAFRVVQLHSSLAATHLGIYVNANGGSAIAGSDTATVRVESVFTHLINLRDALEKDDTLGIVLAGEGIEKDIDIMARVRADVGVRANRVQQQQERSAEMGIMEKALLEDLQGADLTQVITRFSQLQMQMEASMRAGAAAHSMSLLDFLR